MITGYECIWVYWSQWCQGKELCRALVWQLTGARRPLLETLPSTTHHHSSPIRNFGNELPTKITAVSGCSWITGTAISPQLSPAMTVLKRSKLASITDDIASDIAHSRRKCPCLCTSPARHTKGLKNLNELNFSKRPHFVLVLSRWIWFWAKLRRAQLIHENEQQHTDLPRTEHSSPNPSKTT